MRAVVIAFALVGCAGGDYSGPHGDDAGGTTNDANNPNCITFEVFPDHPNAGDHVKVTAHVMGGGVLAYHWRVDGVDNTNYEADDGAAIGFDVPTAVPHTVTVDVSPQVCSEGQLVVPVGNPNGAIAMYRLRIIPPADRAPPQEDVILVHGGTSSDRPFYADPGIALVGSVMAGATAKPAYVTLTPIGGLAHDLVTTGTFTTQVALKMHVVRVIPQDNTLAPRMFAWAAGVGPDVFPVDAGTPVHGIVRDRNNNPLQGAEVQLEQLGLPSTHATTDSTGQFTVGVAFDTTDPVTATITPPATSGLPRLTATGNFDLAQQVQVSYALSPAPCNLAGAAVKRSNVNQGGAVVTVVGALAATAGSVTAGVTANASGVVHVAATANGAGALPALLVPRAALSAVVQLAATDFAVADLDTTACTVTTIDAPPMIAASGVVQDAQQTPQPIVGARVEALPVGALALANLLPVQATTVAGGAFSFQLAAGAHYAVRFYDPSGHGAPRDFPDLTAQGILAATGLAPAVAITGHVAVLMEPNPLAYASVQILCASCTGVAASQPIAQTSIDIGGDYRLAVPDPGDL